MPLFTPAPEPVAFEEVAAVLDEAVLHARGGPPYVIGCGWVAPWPRRSTRLASTWSGCRPIRDSSPFSAREMPDGVHTSKRKDTLVQLPIGELVTWQLLASCNACRADRVLFVRELVERFGGHGRAGIRGGVALGQAQIAAGPGKSALRTLSFKSASTALQMGSRSGSVNPRL